MADLTDWFGKLDRLWVCNKAHMDRLVRKNAHELERVVVDYEQCPRLKCTAVYMTFKDHFTVYVEGADVYIGKGDYPHVYHVCVHFKEKRLVPREGKFVLRGQGNEVACFEVENLEQYYLEDCELINL